MSSFIEFLVDLADLLWWIGKAIKGGINFFYKLYERSTKFISNRSH